MTKTLTELLGLRIPIVQAPMAGALGPELASAVCNAGGLGTLPLWTFDTVDARAHVEKMRALTTRPFAVNLNLQFDQVDLIKMCVEERVPVISLFWKDPAPYIELVKQNDALVIYTASSAKDARRAVECGVDIVVAQGIEAGGHVRGKVSTMALVPAVLDEIGDKVPVIAAGGIADGRGMAAALALGACAVWIGTRFLSCKEANIHPDYRQAILDASEDDTIYLENLFDGGWPDAPHRVLRKGTAQAWIAAGCPASGARPGEGDIVAHDDKGFPITRYLSCTAEPGTTGEIDALPLWAGQGVSMVKKVQSASEILQEINDDAERILRKLGKRVLPDD